MHLANHTGVWWAILGLSVLTDFLFLPIAWALYIALKDFQKHIILAGVVFLLLFIFMDLAVTWPNYASLIQLGGRYAQTADEALRAPVVTAAVYAYEVLSSWLFGVYTILVPAIGIALCGIAMLHGAFGKATAYLGIATGVLGFISVAGPFFLPTLGMTAIITSVFTLLWIVLAGLTLMKLGSAKWVGKGPAT